MVGERVNAVEAKDTLALRTGINKFLFETALTQVAPQLLTDPAFILSSILDILSQPLWLLSLHRALLLVSLHYDPSLPPGLKPYLCLSYLPHDSLWSSVNEK